MRCGDCEETSPFDLIKTTNNQLVVVVKFSSLPATMADKYLVVKILAILLKQHWQYKIHELQCDYSNWATWKKSFYLTNQDRKSVV